MGAKRQYSDEQKAAALIQLDANKGDLTKTSKQINIPIVTLHDWRNGRGTPDAVSEIRTGLKKPIADRIEEIVHGILDFAPNKMPSASFSQLMMGVGIGVDKMLVLRGEANSITQTNMSEDERNLRIAELYDRARARRTGSSSDAI